MSEGSMVNWVNWLIGVGRWSIGGTTKSQLVNTELKYLLDNSAFCCESVTVLTNEKLDNLKRQS